jgi:hypothetical protein
MQDVLFVTVVRVCTDMVDERCAPATSAVRCRYAHVYHEALVGAGLSASLLSAGVLVASGGGRVSNTPPGLMPSVGIVSAARGTRSDNHSAGGWMMCGPWPNLMPSVWIVGLARTALCAGVVMVWKPPPKLMPRVGMTATSRAGFSSACAAANLEQSIPDGQRRTARRQEGPPSSVDVPRRRDDLRREC